uniref:Uncharacterized protein n=1 Tax=Glossina palpalis gambiensis TaxID=67801 RepID=A0A1B0BPY9_9MUSC
EATKRCAVRALEVFKKSKLKKLINVLIPDRTFRMPCILQRRATFKTRIDVIYVCITGTDGVLAAAAVSTLLLLPPLSSVNIKFYECLQCTNLYSTISRLGKKSNLNNLSNISYALEIGLIQRKLSYDPLTWTAIVCEAFYSSAIQLNHLQFPASQKRQHKQ